MTCAGNLNGVISLCQWLFYMQACFKKKLEFPCYWNLTCILRGTKPQVSFWSFFFKVVGIVTNSLRQWKTIKSTFWNDSIPPSFFWRSSFFCGSYFTFTTYDVYLQQILNFFYSLLVHSRPILQKNKILSCCFFSATLELSLWPNSKLN